MRKLLQLLVMASAISVFPETVRAQIASACADTASMRSKFYRETYAVFVSSSKAPYVSQRTTNSIPSLSASQVKLVADTTACRAASIAYDGQLSKQRPSTPVILLELGTTRRVVIKDTGMGDAPWLNMLFDQTFASLISMMHF